MDTVISRLLKGERGILSKYTPGNFPTMYEDGSSNSEIERYFVLYKDVLSFISKYYKSDVNQRKYHEVILGNVNQKIRFDIDIPVDSIKEDKNRNIEYMQNLSTCVLSEVIKSLIKRMLSEFKIELKLDNDLCIYSSCGQDDDIKQSYHVILNNYCFENSDDTKTFCHLCISDIPSELRVYVDTEVYKSCQNFRIVFSSKHGSKRYKLPVMHFLLGGIVVNHVIANGERIISDAHKFSLIVQESLITFCDGCKVLKSSVPVRKVEDIRVDLDLINANLTKVVEELSTKHFSGNFPYKFTSIENGFVNFKRMKPAFCPICERSHENENAFIVFLGTTAEFFCRRNRCKKIIVNISQKKRFDKKEEVRQSRIDEARRLERLETSPIVQQEVIDAIWSNVTRCKIDQ